MDHTSRYLGFCVSGSAQILLRLQLLIGFSLSCLGRCEEVLRLYPRCSSRLLDEHLRHLSQSPRASRITFACCLQGFTHADTVLIHMVHLSIQAATTSSIPAIHWFGTIYNIHAKRHQLLPSSQPDCSAGPVKLLPTDIGLPLKC